MRKRDQAPEKKMAQKLERKHYALLPLVGIRLFLFFLLSNLRAIELRGREQPVQEIDGVWRRWVPGSRSLNPSVNSLEYVGEAGKQALLGCLPTHFTKLRKSSAEPHAF